MSSRGASGRRGAPPLPAPEVQRRMRALMRFVNQQYFQLETVGLRHIPAEGPAVVVANHPTYLDPFTVGWHVRRWITWMAWAEAFSWPGIGWLLHRLGAFPVDTDRPGASTLKAAYGVLEEERLLGIFFEGGRTDAGSFGVTNPFDGPARIALKAKVPVVPVSVLGARRLWPPDRPFPLPGKVRIVFHSPIETRSFARGAASRERARLLTGALVEAIESALPPDGGARPRRNGGRARRG